MADEAPIQAAAPVVPVILAGGVGSRLWPLSRSMFPKQFHAVLGDESFLQGTVRRLDGLGAADSILVCNDAHRFLVAEQCRAIGANWEHLILEPEGRDSAPGIALAAWQAVADHGDAILVVLASDHLIDNTEQFQADVRTAVALAREGKLVTFGVRPQRPETGYGYIRFSGGESAQPILAFAEKPDQATAEQYVSSGEYLWNSGMFVFSARAFLTELAQYVPEMARCTEQAIADANRDMDFLRPGDQFLSSPARSIDYAVMEKTANGMVLPVDFGWNDIGSWSAIWDASPRDQQGNHVVGDVVAVDTHNSYLRADSRLVGTIGVDDLVVVETADAVLVADRARVQDVKDIVESLKSQDRQEHMSHAEVFRPWGSYTGLAVGDRYQVKCIKVNPGQSLSLQLHNHRSEHWIVVKGTARVTNGEDILTLSENQSTYIPVGTKHRLENPGTTALELIEVQVGGYLGEDDIVRFEDVYGR